MARAVPFTSMVAPATAEFPTDSEEGCIAAVFVPAGDGHAAHHIPNVQHYGIQRGTDGRQLLLKGGHAMKQVEGHLP